MRHPGAWSAVTTLAVPGGERGFSLLEMVVAVAIMGFSLGALYHAAGGATRIAQVDQQRSYAIELARSLIALHAKVPRTGLRKAGQTDGGFSWRVVAEPVVLPQNRTLLAGALQRLNVVVSWEDGYKKRRVTLDSVVAGAVEPE